MNPPVERLCLFFVDDVDANLIACRHFSRWPCGLIWDCFRPNSTSDPVSLHQRGHQWWSSSLSCVILLHMVIISLIFTLKWSCIIELHPILPGQFGWARPSRAFPVFFPGELCQVEFWQGPGTRHQRGKELIPFWSNFTIPMAYSSLKLFIYRCILDHNWSYKYMNKMEMFSALR